MILLRFILILSLSISISLAEEHSLKSDFLDSASLIKDGGTSQFSEKNNLYALPFALSTLYYAFKHDKRLSALSRSKNISKAQELTSDFSVVFSFPIIPATSYTLGRINSDDTLINFSKEYLAALYLTLIESAGISLINVHERPDTRNLSPWETKFRSGSSFPSGHIVPYAVLSLKVMQFYGPYYAFIPSVLTYWASQQRMRDGKHYMSDIVGALWLSFFASEGVRRANNYDKNSSFYKKYFERNLEIGIATYKETIGPEITYHF